MLIVLFTINSAFLLVTSLWVVTYANRDQSRSAAISYSFVLAWANVVMTANLLSLLSHLQSPYIFFLTSTCLQILIVLLAHVLCPRRPNFIAEILFLFRKIEFGSYQRIFYILAGFSILMAVLCFCYTPHIPDTLAIKLPRAIFYLQHKTLLPNPAVDNFELMWSPTANATIPWLYFVIYRADLNTLLFFSLANWLLIGFSVFALCRTVGASKKSSLLATGLLLLSEAVIMAGTADSDDIMAAAPFAVGLLALISWIKRPHYLHAVAFGLGMGLSFGNKPFLIFYYPLFGLIGLVALWRLRGNILLKWWHTNIRSVMIALVAAATMSFGVFYENLVLRNSPMAFPKIYTPLRNTDLNTKTMAINLISQNLTLFVAPVAAWYADITSRRRETTQFMNDSTADLIESAFSVNQHDLSEIHSAHGNRTQIMFELYYDHTTQYGFLPHLLVLCLLFVCFRHLREHWLPVVMGASFIVWDITYCMHYKYIAGIMRYWMIIFMASPPVLAIAWDKLQIEDKRWTNQMLKFFFLVVALTTLGGGIKAIYKNRYRSVQSILEGNNTRNLKESFEPAMQELARQLPAYNVIWYYTNPIMQFMHLNPDAQFFMSAAPRKDIPNILMSPDRDPLWTDNPFIKSRYIALPIGEQDTRLYGYYGKCLGGGCYVNNLPPNVAANKKVLLLRIGQPNIEMDLSRVWISPVTKTTSLRAYEMQLIERNAQSNEVALTEWIPVDDRRLVLKKSSKALLVQLRHKGTNEVTKAEYRY